MGFFGHLPHPQPLESKLDRIERMIGRSIPKTRFMLESKLDRIESLNNHAN